MSLDENLNAPYFLNLLWGSARPTILVLHEAETGATLDLPLELIREDNSLVFRFSSAGTIDERPYVLDGPVLHQGRTTSIFAGHSASCVCLLDPFEPSW